MWSFAVEQHASNGSHVALSQHVLNVMWWWANAKRRLETFIPFYRCFTSSYPCQRSHEVGDQWR